MSSLRLAWSVIGASRDHGEQQGAGSAGTLTNLQPGFEPGGSVSLFSAVIDFVL